MDMTESSSDVVSKPAPEQGFWEDLIDIFFAPVGVFQRWQNKSFWPPLLFVAISFGVITFVTFNTLEPAFDAEIRRNIEAAAKGGRTMPADALERSVRIGLTISRYSIAVIMVISMFVVGIASWLVGTLFSSKQTFHAAMVVAAWAYMPRVLGAVLGGVQGLLMDPSKLTSPLAISIGPARFLDVATANPLLLQLLGRLDLMIVWETVLLAIGLYVTGKVSKSNAALFGVLIWFVGSLERLRAGFLAM
jgi:hypothetical protein